MHTLNAVEVWCKEQAGPLVILTFLLGFLSIARLFSVRSQQARANELRSGAHEESFVDYMSIYGFDPEIARSTYRYLQDQQFASLPIQVDDRLKEDLGLDMDEVDEAVRELLAMNGKLYQPGIANAPMMSVEDLVRFLQASPRLKQSAAA